MSTYDTSLDAQLQQSDIIYTSSDVTRSSKNLDHLCKSIFGKDSKVIELKNISDIVLYKRLQSLKINGFTLYDVNPIRLRDGVVICSYSYYIKDVE